MKNEPTVKAFEPTQVHTALEQLEARIRFREDCLQFWTERMQDNAITRWLNQDFFPRLSLFLFKHLLSWTQVWKSYTTCADNIASANRCLVLLRHEYAAAEKAGTAFTGSERPTQEEIKD